jgi:hypothetical protein
MSEMDEVGRRLEAGLQKRFVGVLDEFVAAEITRLRNPFDGVCHVWAIQRCRHEIDGPNGLAQAGCGQDENDTRELTVRFLADKRQEVVVIRDKHTLQSDRSTQVLLIAGPEQTHLGCRDNIYASPAQTRNHSRVHALVGVELQRHAGRLRPRPVRSPRVLRAHLGDQSSTLLPVPANGLSMIVIVHQRGVNVGQRQVGVRLDDLVWSHPKMLGFARKLADLDVCPRHNGTFARFVNVRNETGRGFHGRSRTVAPGGAQRIEGAWTGVKVHHGAAAHEHAVLPSMRHKRGRPAAAALRVASR